MLRLTTSAVLASSAAALRIGDPRDIPGLQFVTLPGGTFTMGATEDSFPDESPSWPQHEVEVSSFAMMTTEVTNDMYVAFANEALDLGMIEVNDNFDSGAGAESGYPAIYQVDHDDPDMAAYDGDQWQVDAPGDLHGEDAVNECYVHYSGGEFVLEDASKAQWPAIFVRYYGAKAFCDYYGLELPTEAQWEYAAQGGEGYDWGTNDGTHSASNCNYDGNVGNVVDVGSYPANPFGLYDLCGNAWEWTQDWWSDGYDMWSDGVVDPVYTDGVEPANDGTETGGPGVAYSDQESTRITRGGAYNYHATACASRYRRGEYPFRGNDHFGFRCAMTLREPLEPRNAAATAGVGSAGLSWDAAFGWGDEVTQYVVTADASGASITLEGTPPATSTTFSDLTNDVPTTFTIVAVNGQGQSASATTNEVTPNLLADSDVPFKPTGVEVAPGYQHANVSWQAPLDNGAEITEYTVWSNQGGEWTVDGASTSLVADGLSGKAAYIFNVAATNAVGQGQESVDSDDVLVQGPVDAVWVITLEGVTEAPADGALEAALYAGAASLSEMLLGAHMAEVTGWAEVDGGIEVTVAVTLAANSVVEGAEGAEAITAYINSAEFATALGATAAAADEPTVSDPYADDEGDESAGVPMAAVGGAAAAVVALVVGAGVVRWRRKNAVSSKRLGKTPDAPFQPATSPMRETQMATFANPAAPAAVTGGAGAAAAFGGSLKANSANWREAKDPATGKKYYFNVVTNATQWTPPPGF